MRSLNLFYTLNRALITTTVPQTLKGPTVKYSNRILNQHSSKNRDIHTKTFSMVFCVKPILSGPQSSITYQVHKAIRQADEFLSLDKRVRVYTDRSSPWIEGAHEQFQPLHNILEKAQQLRNGFSGLCFMML